MGHPALQAATVRLDGRRSRVLAAMSFRSTPGVSLAIVSSQSEIDEARAAVGRKLLLGVLGSLLLIAPCVSYRGLTPAL